MTNVPSANRMLRDSTQELDSEQEYSPGGKSQLDGGEIEESEGQVLNAELIGASQALKEGDLAKYA